MIPLRIKILSALSLILIVACRSHGTPEDQGMAADLWRDLDGYQRWAQFEGYPGIQKSKSSMHGKFVATYINAIAAADPKGLPDGSVIVKENFSKNDRATLNGLTVMKRVSGYDPEGGDWFWARYEPNGGPTHAGKVSMCADCHFDAGNDDFVFLND